MNIVYFASVSKGLSYSGRPASSDLFIYTSFQKAFGSSVYLCQNEFRQDLLNQLYFSGMWETDFTVLAYDVPKKQDLFPFPSQKVAENLLEFRNRIGQHMSFVMPQFSSYSFSDGSASVVGHQNKLLDMGCVLSIHPEFHHKFYKFALMRLALNHLACATESDPEFFPPNSVPSRPKVRFRDFSLWKDHFKNKYNANP